MSGFLKLVLTLVFTAIVFWIVLVNRAAVDFSLEPVFTSLSLPLAVVVFISVLFGFIWGAAIVWLNGAALRSENRRQKKELKKISTES